MFINNFTVKSLPAGVAILQLSMPEQTLWDQLPTDDTSVTVGIFVLGLAMYWLWETVNSAMEEKMKGKKAALQAARAKTA